jgi:hypothetical protein
MRWLSWARGVRAAASGRAAWVGTGSSRLAGWRWYPHAFGDGVERTCPLELFCPERERQGHGRASGLGIDPVAEIGSEQGPALGDVPAVWWFGEDPNGAR